MDKIERKACLNCRYSGMGNYCWKCGKLLVDISTMKCECGQSVSFRHRFCVNCGQKITEDKILCFLEAREGGISGKTEGG